jgi:hypothetical protein
MGFSLIEKKDDTIKAYVSCLLLLTLGILGCRSNRSPAPESRKLQLTKKVEVFGLFLYATDRVADEKLLHAARVLAEYLDNDESGIPDNPLVLEALLAQDAAILMGCDEDELRSLDRGGIPPGATQFLYDYETRPGGAERGVFDAAVEEILHPITDVGYATAYPDVFGTGPGSEVARIMDEARGGHFEKVPEKYPESAWYTYYDKTCLYECQVTEYVYWALTSILGAQDFPGRLEQIRQEWRYNTPEKVRMGDPKVYNLLTDPQYRFPTFLPNGDYAANSLTIQKHESLILDTPASDP